MEDISHNTSREKTPKEVFSFLKHCAFDKEHFGEIVVLPLMCGLGKSTAISYFIRYTIERMNEKRGLLIVTDRKDRMSDYMHPHDHNLEKYLNEHENCVTIMTHENLLEAKTKQESTPVLLMTTQRFFHLDPFAINFYLHWGKERKRTVILIDERPELTTVVDLDRRKFNDCKLAIEEAYQKPRFGGFARELPAYHPELIKAMNRYEQFVDRTREKPCCDEERLYCFWSWYHENCEDKTQEGYFNKAFEQIGRNRENINNFGGGDYYEDIYTRIKAIDHMRKFNGLFSQYRTKDKFHINHLYSILDNYSLIKNTHSKVVILDGTADLSPEYSLHDYYVPDCTQFKRDLSNLTIYLINIPTGKTTLKSSASKQNDVLDCVDLYFQEGGADGFLDRR